MKGTWTPETLAWFFSSRQEESRPVLAAGLDERVEGVEPFLGLGGVVIDGRGAVGGSVAVAAVGCGLAVGAVRFHDALDAAFLDPFWHDTISRDPLLANRGSSSHSMGITGGG